ncbi:hypothetical protein [Streptomyces sp. MAR4 CNX-425]|uniref:hypothetical protein n=1 Tax=Streptomyces sp. MAR4 CNX-425 TaxID=3406343 RepID=UPI003B50DB27
MGARRELVSLLATAARGGGTHRLRSPWVRPRRLAAFVYVAEQYGYRYDGIASHPTASAPTLLFRRLPDAAERADRTARRHPDAPRGGPLPGMRPGRRRLVPLPEVRPEVELLFAPFLLDSTEESYARKRRRHVLITVVLWMVLVAVTGAFSTDSLSVYLELVLVVDGVLAALLVTVLPLSRAATRRTRRRADRVLARAGAARPARRAEGGRRTAG